MGHAENFVHAWSDGVNRGGAAEHQVEQATEQGEGEDGQNPRDFVVRVAGSVHDIDDRQQAQGDTGEVEAHEVLGSHQHEAHHDPDLDDEQNQREQESVGEDDGHPAEEAVLRTAKGFLCGLFGAVPALSDGFVIVGFLLVHPAHLLLFASTRRGDSLLFGVIDALRLQSRSLFLRSGRVGLSFLRFACRIHL